PLRSQLRSSHMSTRLGCGLLGPLSGAVVDDDVGAARPQPAGHRRTHPTRPDDRDGLPVCIHSNSVPPLTSRFTPLTAGFRKRNSTAWAISPIVASLPVGVRDRYRSSTSGGLPLQYGLSPTIPGWIALTRMGASSTARLWTRPITPPLTVETVCDPGYGRIAAMPPNTTIDPSSPIRLCRTWTTSV